MSKLHMWEAGPTFFVIGAQKAGTTRLCELLNRHPQVTIPLKEPWFFDSDDAMSSKASWYQGLFDRAPLATARGDGSTTYAMLALHPGTAERLHAFNPEARIIYLVRHPIERIESAWVQLLSVGEVNGFLGFERTLTETEQLIDPSRYWRQLEEYRRYFPDDQIQIHFFEDFVIDERSVLKSCLSFLNVDASLEIDTRDDSGRNPREGKRQRLPLVDAVRALPGYERYKRAIPQFAKTLFTDHITRAVPLESPWTPEALSWARAQLAADSAAFLVHAGKPADYWSAQ
jgi:Sulfotransferase domain